MISTTVRNTIIAAALSSICLIATAVSGYVRAQHLGAEAEKAVAAANTLAKDEFAALAAQMFAVTGTVDLSTMPPAKALKFAQRWRPKSSYYLSQSASPEQVQTLRLKIASAKKAHISAESAKQDYQALLDSTWTGFWLRVGGYPKAPL